MDIDSDDDLNNSFNIGDIANLSEFLLETKKFENECNNDTAILLCFGQMQEKEIKFLTRKLEDSNKENPATYTLNHFLRIAEKCDSFNKHGAKNAAKRIIKKYKLQLNYQDITEAFNKITHDYFNINNNDNYINYYTPCQFLFDKLLNENINMYEAIILSINSYVISGVEICNLVSYTNNNTKIIGVIHSESNKIKERQITRILCKLLGEFNFSIDNVVLGTKYKKIIRKCFNSDLDDNLDDNFYAVLDDNLDDNFYPVLDDNLDDNLDEPDVPDDLDELNELDKIKQLCLNDTAILLNFSEVMDYIITKQILNIKKKDMKDYLRIISHITNIIEETEDYSKDRTVNAAKRIIQKYKLQLSYQEIVGAFKNITDAYVYFQNTSDTSKMSNSLIFDFKSHCMKIQFILDKLLNENTNMYVAIINSINKNIIFSGEISKLVAIERNNKLVIGVSNLILEYPLICDEFVNVVIKILCKLLDNNYFDIENINLGVIGKQKIYEYILLKYGDKNEIINKCNVI